VVYHIFLSENPERSKIPKRMQKCV
jgi:hypothetical protein